ncbi:MAG: hypothetical protein COA49_08180 [Bacteroidetes bacterium]|nr:MAG: hypothetical protein COA49_08180 [Bacteroidota bacterium]
MNRLYSSTSLLLSYLLVILLSNTLAQTDVLNAVWILNEGVQDWETGEMTELASVGVYSPVTHEYMEVYEFEGSSFTTNVVIAEGSAFIGADNKIVKLNLDTYEVEAEVALEGVRQLAFYDGMIYVTRGDVDPVTWASVEFDSYFVWFDAETLSWVGEMPTTEGISYASEGLVIDNGVAYIAINNGFAWAQEVGILGVYDLNNGAYNEFDLGEDGKNPAHIKLVDGAAVLVNNTDWSATSLSRVELTSLGAEMSTVTTSLVAGVSSGCNAAAIMGDEIVFQISGEMGMRKASTEDLTASVNIWGPVTDSYYRMALNPINGNIYATVTNFYDAGEVQIIDDLGTLITSFETGTIPGGIAFDIRTVLSIDQLEVSNNGELIGEFDVMGRVWSKGNRGVKIERFSNGNTRARYIAE